MALIQKYQTPSSKKSSLVGEYTASRDLNMRYGASTKYAVVDILKKGDVFVATGQFTDNNGTPWLYGTYSGKKGFCSSRYLKKIEAKSPMKSIKKGETTENIKDIFKFFRNIKFAKGAIYNITSSLIIYSDTVIDLNGATLRRYSGCSTLKSFVDPDVTTGYNGVKNVIIKNGTIEGMNGYGFSTSNLTSWMHCDNITFENVTFLDTPGCHSCDLVGCNDITFKNCKFLGYCSAGSSGDFRESIQIDFASYSSLPSYPKNSKCYDMTYCKNIVIDGCIFDKSKTYPAQYCAIGTHTQGNDNNYHENVTIKNCIANGNGVSKGTASYGAFVRCMKFKNTLIENNTISNYGRMVWITMPGVLINPNGTSVKATNYPDKVMNVDGLKILNNTIVSKGANWKYYAVYVKDTFKKSKNIIIDGLNVPRGTICLSGCKNISIKL